MTKRPARKPKKPNKPKTSKQPADPALPKKQAGGAKRIIFDLKKVQRYASQGMTHTEVALALGCSARTVEQRLADDADFADAIKKGKASGIQKITNALFLNATKSKQVAAQIFFLKAQAGWKDRVELTGKDGGPLIPPSNLKPGEILARAQKLIEAAKRATTKN